jgi:hypothetical protein
MAGSGNGKRRFEVHCSGALIHTFRRIHRRASRHGKGQAVTKAFRHIIRRLEFDPFQVGGQLALATRLPGGEG